MSYTSVEMGFPGLGIEKFTVETNINAYFDDNTIEESEETDNYTLETEG